MTDISQLSDAELFSALPKTPENFTAQYAPVAARVGEKLGVDPSILLGQWGHETGWGKSVIPGTNNLGNIKGNGPAATDNMNGSRDTYAAYQSPDEFGDAYANLIQSRYPGAVGAGNDVAKFTGGLKGYAEDPAYPQRLRDAQKSIPERLLSAIIPSASAQERPADVSQMSNEELARAAGVDISQISNEDLAKAAGVQLPQQPATPAQQAAFGSQGQPEQQPPLTGNDLLRKQLGIANPITDRQKAAAAVYGGLEGGPLNEFTHGITSGAANLVGGAAQLAGHGIGAGLNALDFPNAGAAVSGAGDTVARYLNQGTPDSVAGQVGQAVGASALPVPGSGVTRAAVGGAAMGAAQPVLDGQDYWSQKAQQAGIGAAMGGALGAVGNVIGGKTLSKNAQALVDNGVTITPGQALGPMASKFEERAASTPIFGEFIAGARQSAVNDVNRAAMNRALEPTGQTITAREFSDQGLRNSVDKVATALGDKYDELLPKLTLDIDPALSSNLNAVEQNVAASTMPQQQIDRFSEIIDKSFGNRLNTGGKIAGTDFKDMESKLTQAIGSARQNPDPDIRQMGQHLQRFQDALRQGLQTSNPTLAPELKSLNRGWANYAILRSAASKVNNPELALTPAQLQTAVRSNNKTVGKGGFAKGQALMQDLSDPAFAVLGNKVPDSGTASRIMQGLLIGGSGGVLGAHNPLVAIPAAILTAAVYGTATGRKAALAAIASRPDWARQFATVTKGMAPAAGGIGAGLLSGTSGQ